MTKAVTKIPVVWETKKSVANRLLGETGRPLLDRLLAETQTIAAKRRWPLQKLKVDYYQDPEEVDWEYMLITLDFDCPRDEAAPLFWCDYIKGFVTDMHRGLEGEEKEIFATKIHYELESDP